MRKEAKDLINKRKIAYIYLMHRMFEGNPAMMIKIMKIKEVSVADLEDWDIDYKAAVYQTIQEEDTKGVRLRDQTEVPSIKSIKEKLLRRCDALVNTTDDPARLAQVYKILSEFETVDDKKEKTVLDAINESIKPLTPKKHEEVKTMLEKIKSEKAANARRGRKNVRKRVEHPDVNEQFAGLDNVELEEEPQEEIQEQEE